MHTCSPLAFVIAVASNLLTKGCVVLYSCISDIVRLGKDHERDILKTGGQLEALSVKSQLSGWSFTICTYHVHGSRQAVSQAQGSEIISAKILIQIGPVTQHGYVIF